VVLSSVIAGASGGALANVALSPLGGGAGLLQSYWYGAGLILGERMMYTFHWEKINARISKDEDFLSVLESEMNPAITAIANYSLQVMQKTGAIYMQGGIDFMAKLIENMLKLLAGEEITPSDLPNPCPAGFHLDASTNTCVSDAPPTPIIDCPAGFRWSASAQQCVPEDIPEPTPTPTPTPEPEPEFGPFIPPIFDSSKTIAHQAIGRVRAFVPSNPATSYVVDTQLVKFEWTQLTGFLSTQKIAMDFASKAWPFPKYGVRIENNIQYFVRLQ